ncbi:hypothetical protein PYCCODRAFT_1437943 [Trametes coccinea BRFM310]|uniref:Protein-S-isoprenylcysteine O-methyltransferase n=1 Tax=Trametes coccinea (strain BRFM310) TaxID=1353009 RepID=A0A1Y2IF06_TRAC3|nr:hypothetical protein PYCCODRAFT_1437943 [Trametes coccinea BRFM310]
MSLLKIFALISSAGLFSSAIGIPLPRATAKGTHIDQMSHFMVLFLAYASCGMVIASSLCHALLLVDAPRLWSYLDPSFFCPSPTLRLYSLVPISPKFVLGTVLVMFGAAFRLWSHRTFSGALRGDVLPAGEEAWITTGSSAHVRHPSYLGLVLTLIGAHAIHFGAGGYVTECGVEIVPAIRGLAWAWRVGILVCLAYLFRRCDVEDARMESLFGNEWRRYRRDV